MDIFVQQQAGACRADLAFVGVNGPEGGGDGGVEVGVREDDVRRLASELERQALEVALSRRLEQGAGAADAAGEGDLVDVHVTAERFSCLRSVAGDHVYHAVWHARLLAEFGEPQRRERGKFRGLDDARAACGQCGRHLPGRQQHWVVPRRDHSHHADRLAQGVVHERPVNRNDLAVQVARPARVVVENVGGGFHVAPLRSLERFARVQALDHRQLVAVFVDQLSDPPEDFPAFRGVHLRPGTGLECLARGLDGAIDVRRLAPLDRGQKLARRGVHHVDLLPRSAFARLTSDKKPAGLEFLHDGACIHYGNSFFRFQQSAISPPPAMISVLKLPADCSRSCVSDCTGNKDEAGVFSGPTETKRRAEDVIFRSAEDDETLPRRLLRSRCAHRSGRCARRRIGRDPEPR